MTHTLLLIDIQNDYFPGGTMTLVGMEQAAHHAQTLLAHARARGWSVVHVQHLAARPGATFFLPGTPGAEHHPSVAPQAGETVIVKHFPNAFRNSALATALPPADLTQLVVVGAMSHMCIDATTRAAFDLGYQCTVLADACATRDLLYNGDTLPAAQVHAAFMAGLAAPFARVIATATLLTESA